MRNYNVTLKVTQVFVESISLLDVARKRTTKSWTWHGRESQNRGHWLCSSRSTFYGHRGASK